jgi:hypothetical protein
MIGTFSTREWKSSGRPKWKGSKYRLLSNRAIQRLGNFGQVDNTDLPSIAIPRLQPIPAEVPASVRQSIIGLTGIGPELSARTSATCKWTSADCQWLRG